MFKKSSMGVGVKMDEAFVDYGSDESSSEEDSVEDSLENCYCFLLFTDITDEYKKA